MDKEPKIRVRGGSREGTGPAGENPEDTIIPPLLPIPPGTGPPNDILCGTCKGLQLTPESFIIASARREAENMPDDPNIPLGFVKDIKKKVNCPFCRLVLFAIGGPDHIDDIPTEEDGEAVTVALSWNTDGPIPDAKEFWNHIPQIRILRPYLRKAGGDYADTMNLNLFPEITLLANDSPASPLFFPRPVQDQIDFGMVRNWLSICQKWHGTACNKAEMFNGINPTDEIPSFRLVDVVDNCIVRASSGCKYATLSYVWGKTPFLRSLQSNVNTLEQHGSLLRPEFSDQIPWTIRDGMEVVKKLNLRYLWVDSLCIVQDDDERDRMESISKMDLIFGACFLPIMAATGKDANAGLPGVRPGTRGQRQPIEEIMPGLRLAFKDIHHNYIKDAAYYTRAWTFQEQMFAPRSLLFIGGQVVFRCGKTDQWREDVVFEDPSTITANAKFPRSVNDIGTIEGMIQSYSGLSMTYDSDVYNAFAGISRYFRTHLDVDLCHGIPDAYFDWCLLWGALKAQKRRESAPSWSWSGWIGESWLRIWDWYTRDLPKIHNALQHRTWIIWYQRVAHDSIDCVRVWTPPLDGHSSESSSTPKNFYGGPIVKRFPFDCTQTEPTPRKLANAPQYYKDRFNVNPGSGFLQFWTVSVVFNLDKPTSKNNENDLRNEYVRVGMFGREGREVGAILVTEEWRDANVPGRHELILLCEGRDKRADSGMQDEEPGWKYMVMLLEWHGEWAGRVAVGSIEIKADLDQALEPGAVWKEIILG